MKPRDIFVSNSNTVLILDLKKPIQNRTFSMSHNRDCDTNATANIILKEILRLYFGVENKDLTIERNKFGKPFLPSQTNAWFNLSHSGTSMAVALSRVGEVGVDIEYHAKNKDYAKIARRFFHDKEVTDLNRLKPEDIQKRAHMLWCLKEAYIKALGLGLAKPLNSFRFNIRRQHIDLYESKQMFTSKVWQCHYLKLNKNYGLATCVPHGNSIYYFCLNRNREIIPSNIYH